MFRTKNGADTKSRNAGKAKRAGNPARILTFCLGILLGAASILNPAGLDKATAAEPAVISIRAEAPDVTCGHRRDSKPPQAETRDSETNPPEYLELRELVLGILEPEQIMKTLTAGLTAPEN